MRLGGSRMSVKSVQEDRSFDELIALVKNANGATPDVCAMMYHFINDHQGSEGKLFRTAAEAFGKFDTTASVKVPKVEWDSQDLQRSHAKTIDAYLETVIEKNGDEEKFYSTIWSFIQNPLFETEAEREFAFFWIMIDKRIPYYHLPSGLRLQANEFRDLSKRIKEKTSIAKFVLERDFEQWTEQADILRQVVFDGATAEEWAGLMAYILRYAQRSRSISEMIRDA